MQKVSYGGWSNCYRLSNDKVEMIVTGDVGPRIIRFGFIGQDNEFQEFEALMGMTGGDEWRVYGGHRFWHAPEVQPRTYAPDNEPVAVTQHGEIVRVVQPIEATTGIQKEIDLYLAPDSPHAKLTHRLRNTNLWAVELAPWALSVMAQGGVAIIPLPPRGSHEGNLLPANTITLWAYTDMSDARWTWGHRYIMLRQDPSCERPQKAGVMVPDGWVAYAREGHLFLKTFPFVPGASYPDLGCSVETFTNHLFLEAETLAPLVRLEPGAEVEYVEDWYLFRDVPTPKDEADVERHVLPKVQLARAG
jgi:hypothetical protein